MFQVLVRRAGPTILPDAMSALIDSWIAWKLE